MGDRRFAQCAEKMNPKPIATEPMFIRPVGQHSLVLSPMGDVTDQFQFRMFDHPSNRAIGCCEINRRGVIERA